MLNRISVITYEAHSQFYRGNLWGDFYNETFPKVSVKRAAALFPVQGSVPEVGSWAVSKCLTAWGSLPFPGSPVWSPSRAPAGAGEDTWCRVGTVPATSLKKRRFFWITEETSKLPRADHQAVTAPVLVGAAAPHEAVPQQPQGMVLAEEQQRFAEFSGEPAVGRHEAG